jgi:hypothetical protein
VTTTDTKNEPRHPSRLLKKNNMRFLPERERRPTHPGAAFALLWPSRDQRRSSR